MKYQKLKSLMFFGLISLTGFAQEEDPFKLPNYTPASPEASAMTKYSDVTINEFTGMVSKTIPLYSYKAGNLELPISLNYTGAGVRVDDLPTWVGINWTLNAGGVITRSVRDIADEVAVTRVFFSDSDVINYNSTIDGTTNGAFLRSVISNNQVDSEVDIFQYSFSGYSGSFYIDNDWNAKLLKSDSPIKIDVISRSNLYHNKTILITTPDGVVYTFGGSTATEETSRRSIINGTMESQNTVEGTTAFYLKSIKHPLYGEILFDYTQNLGNEIIVSQKIQKLSRVLEYDDLGTCEVFSPDTGSTQAPTCSNSMSLENQSSLITISTRVLNPKYLTKIYSYNTNEIIHFNSDSIDNRNFKRELKSISIDKDNNLENGNFKRISFEYMGRVPSSSSIGYQDVSKRFFLKKIIFDDENDFAFNTVDGRRNEIYTFEYDGYNSLPPRFDFGQDYGGYYNGIVNQSGIPSDPHFDPNNNGSFADRSPNFKFASKGALSRIIYPTGGYTVFQYEAPKARKKINEGVALEVHRNIDNRIDDLIDAVPKIGPVDENGDFSIIFGGPRVKTESISINISASAYHSNSYITFHPQQEKVVITVKDITTTPHVVVATKTISFSNPPPLSNEGWIDEFQTLNCTFQEGKTYEVKLEIPETGEIEGTEVPMTAMATFSYFKGDVITDGLGVRLKRHTNYSKDEQPEDIKRYYYTEIDKINPPIEDLPLLSGAYIKTDKDIINKICNTNSMCVSMDAPFLEIWYLIENIYSDKYNYSSVPNIGNYKNVTISYGGDNFENGGVEKTFSLFDDYGATHIKTLPGLHYRSMVQSLNYVGTNPDVLKDYKIPSNLNGILLREKIFKNQTILKKIQENIYTYDFNPLEKFNCVFSKKEFDPLFFYAPANVNNTASNYTIGSYIVESKKSEITQKQTIEYIDPVPLGALDESIYKKIVTTQDFQYGNLRGLPTIVTSSSSESGISNITKNYYVTDDLSGMGLSTSQVDLLNILANKNIVNKPFQSEQFQNTEKLSTIRTVYSNISTSPSFQKVVPSIIQSGKGDTSVNPLESRVYFNQYDDFGRPIMVSLDSGSKTKYYYNTRGQLVMKIENYVAPTGTGTEFTGEDIVESTNPCSYHVMFPLSLVTVYEYNDINNQIRKIIDYNCRETKYEYDELHRLKYIKDNEDKIIQEFDSSFKRY